MTEAEFRALALSFPGAAEGFNMGSAFFKVNGKDLCRLLGGGRAMLTGVDAAESEMLIAAAPEVFDASQHFKDARCLAVTLATVTPEMLRPYLDRRFQQIARKAVLKAWETERAGA